MPTRFIKEFYCPDCGFREEVKGFVVEYDLCPVCEKAEKERTDLIRIQAREIKNASV